MPGRKFLLLPMRLWKATYPRCEVSARAESSSLAFGTSTVRKASYIGATGKKRSAKGRS
jgi:hypothetical protein